MDLLHLERYEYKYFVPEERTEDIRRFIQPYVRLDEYAAGAADRRYTIHNLYLDTPNFDFYQACLNGEVDRFKLRLRWYDAEAQGPFFFEVKRKIRNVIVKDRARLEGNEISAALRGGPLSLPDGPTRDHLTGFLDRKISSGSVPAIFSRYTREPYESVFGNYARLTFDREMCFQPAESYKFPADPRAWNYVDAAWATGGLRCAAVLELKFTRDFPRWMSDLVAEFDLEPQGFSKYVMSIHRRIERAQGRMDLQRHAMHGG